MQLNDSCLKEMTIAELVANSQDCPELREFREFHRTNPELMDFLVREIQKWLDRGFTEYSCGNLWEYARWTLALERGPQSTYKMNDRLEPFYSRAVVILHPEFNGKQEFRTAYADKIFGTMIDAPKKRPKNYARKLQWDDGTPLTEAPSTQSKKPSLGVKPTPGSKENVG